MKKDISFGKRAVKYDTGFEGKLSQRFYIDLISSVSVVDGNHVLDVGCGTGTILYNLSQTAEIFGYGIDISDDMLNEARKKCPDMLFQIGDSGSLPFEDNFMDIVIACMAYHHFSNQDSFRREALRVLKPHGKVYICDPLFPYPIRKTINEIFKLSNASARFYNTEEIKIDFEHTGFICAESTQDAYVQVLVFEKA